MNKSENNMNNPIFIKEDQSLNDPLYKRIYAQLGTPTEKTISELLPANVLHTFPTYGVSLSSATTELIEYMKAPASGVFVSTVNPGFFNDAGIMTGDIILEFNGWPLDNYGHTTVSPSPSSQQLNIYDLGERIKTGSTINMTIWRNNQKLIKFAIFKYDQIEKDKIKFIEEPARENIEYEVFGGMVLMQLTWNHIANFAKSNSGLAEYLYNPTKDTTSRLVISSVLYPANTIPEGSVYQGDILSKVNGHSIKTLKDFREFLVPDQQYCSFTTEKGDFLVMDFIYTLMEELRISSLNGYDLTPHIKQLLNDPSIREKINEKFKKLDDSQTEEK